MTTRHDISAVPLQNSYVAKRCPVRAQNDAILPAERVEPDPFARRLIDQGDAFEREIVAELLLSEPDAVLVERNGSLAETQTLAAMSSGAPLILNGEIVDVAGRRVGRPDLLVIAPDHRYRAVDIKGHGVLEVPAESAKSIAVPLISDLAAPTLETAHPEPTLATKRHEDDVLQLAHYQRILEAMGFAAKDGRFGGIIGTERQLVWHDLDSPLWRTSSLSAKSKMRSAMERYDFEFDFRLDIIAVARQRLVDPAVDLLVVPVRCDECPTCPWSGYCTPILEAPPGDVSLLPRVGWLQRKVHHDHGVTNLADLAALDIRTATLVAQGVDVERLLTITERAPPAAAVASVDGVSSRPKEEAALEGAGISTVGDLATLCPKTAAYHGSGLTSLPTQIDLARATLGPAAAYRKRGVASVSVPRADVEVDIDMENVQDGCYLWGCLVTDRSDNDLVPSGYKPFVTWLNLTSGAEVENSLKFWRWLTSLRDTTLEGGHTFHAYCFSAAAENTQLRRLGTASQLEEEVEAFIDSEDWVDMMKVWDAQLTTGGSKGLKTIASIAGFQWEVDDPGGGESMIMYDIAVGDGPDGAPAREWLLRYNRGDVEATRAVRQWMERAEIPSVEDLGS